MGIDYDTGTTFYERFEFKIQPSALFPEGLYIELIPWSGNWFNLIRISLYRDNTERHLTLDELTEPQKKFIRDNIAKHYVRHRQFSQNVKGDFAIEENTSKYWLHMHQLGTKYVYGGSNEVSA